MSEFIGIFLSDRSFHVRIGFCLSDAFNQEMGVPQGSILSVTLFILRTSMNSVTVFDRKLTFAAHIKYLKDRCLKALNLLRVVAHKDWGADTATLLKLYRTHVRSKLDFGCVVYGSARPSALES